MRKNEQGGAGGPSVWFDDADHHESMLINSLFLFTLLLIILLILFLFLLFPSLRFLFPHLVTHRRGDDGGSEAGGAVGGLSECY